MEYDPPIVVVPLPLVVRSQPGLILFIARVVIKDFRFSVLYLDQIVSHLVAPVFFALHYQPHIDLVFLSN